MFKLDQETNKIMMIFKTVEEKQIVASMLSEITVKIGLERKSPILFYYYGKNEPDFVTASCINLGLLNLMAEDFFIVKEVMGYKIVMNFLKSKERFLKIV